VACAPENVEKAVSAVPAEELFILPVSVGTPLLPSVLGSQTARGRGRALCLPSLPAGGTAPRLAPRRALPERDAPALLVAVLVALKGGRRDSVVLTTAG
jgi:hypothetical protein